MSKEKWEKDAFGFLGRAATDKLLPNSNFELLRFRPDVILLLRSTYTSCLSFFSDNGLKKLYELVVSGD